MMARRTHSQWHHGFHRPQRRFALENLPELIAQDDDTAEHQLEYVTGDQVIALLRGSSLDRHEPEGDLGNDDKKGGRP
jgi:hypothetical protein